MSNNICIFLHQGVGDCVMTLPTLSRISNKGNHNKRKIYVVVKSTIEAEVVKLSSLDVEKFFFVGSKSRWQRFLNLVWASVLLRFKGVDVLIAPIMSGNLFNYIVLRIISACEVFVPGEKYISQFSRPNELTEYGLKSPHYSIYIANFFHLSGLIDAESLDEIVQLNSVSDVEMEKIFSKVFRSVAIGPGCGVSETNKVPSDSWFVSLAVKISKIDSIDRVLLYGGESDRRLLEMMSLAFSNFKIKTDILINININTLISELKCVDVIISGTTGPGHLAGISETPMIVLSEPTNPRESAPFSKYVKNIRAGLKCSPCYRRGFPNGCGFRCCDLISHNDIINIITNKRTEKKINIKSLLTKQSISLKL